MRNFIKRRLCAVVVLPGLAFPLPAIAQLEEIIVTARKRAETMQDIPVVVSVMDKSQMDQYQSGNVYDMALRVPGLVMSTGTMSFGAQTSMRGVGTSTLNATLDQSVSLNIDGLQMTQGLAYSAGMFDMEQLEVLKGPQALFFGKGSPAGVISFRTTDPGDEFELIGRHGYEFNAKHHRTDLIVSGPVSDTLGLRLAATWSEQDGWMKNRAEAAPGTGARTPRYKAFPHKEEWLVRGTALWTPADRFSARLKINTMRTESRNDGGLTQMASCPDGIVAPSGIPFIGGGEDCRYDDVIRVVDLDPAAFPGIANNGTPFNEMEQLFGSLEMNYDLSPQLTLTSVTGYYDLDQEALINGTNSTYAASALAANPRFLRRDYTQELRLTSSFSDSPFDFMLGGFYQDGEMRYHNNLLGNTALGLPAQLALGFQDVETSTLSFFGQLMWSPIPEVEVAAGARWTDEKRRHTIWNSITGVAARHPTPTPRLRETDVSPELTITYMPTDNLTFFGAYKQAFKSGSFDTVLIYDSDHEVSFGDEKVEGGEIGLKSTWLDRRMQFNIAAYFYEFDDIQVGAMEITEEGENAIRTMNAASSEVYGVEFDMTYLPASVPGLSLYTAGNYNRAEYDEFTNAQCWGGQRIQDGCNHELDEEAGLYRAQDLSGRPMLRAPRWSGHVGLNYETGLQTGMTLGLGWYTTYSSKYLTNMLARDDMWQNSFFTHNASISLKGANDTWEVALIGNNLTDKLVRGNCVNSNSSNAALFGGIISGAPERGPAGVEELTCDVTSNRAIWLRFSMKLHGLMGRR